TSMSDCKPALLSSLVEQRRQSNAPERSVAVPTVLPSPSPNATERPVSETNARIAIIGIDGRFPHAPTLSDFWKNLTDGRDCVTELPNGHWSMRDYYDPEPAKPGKTNCKGVGLLEEADTFDPLFFNI